MLSFLLTSARERGPIASLDDYLARYHAVGDITSIERAVLGGFVADRLGYAFIGGYQAAFRALVPTMLPDSAIVSLCATESGGGHPRAINSRLHEHRLNGGKRWATLSPRADILLVVASVASDDERAQGRNRLKVVRLDAKRAGITITKMPDTPFAPEIPHAEIVFKDVVVEHDDVLEGDGYDTYLKPFRTHEDLHVLGAAVGYFIGEARDREWSHALIERLLALALSIRDLANVPPGAPEGHVALGGIFQVSRAIIAEVDALFALDESDARTRWERDRGLLTVADGVRAKRLEAAWARIG